MSMNLLRRPALSQKIGLGTSAIYAKLKYNPARPADFDPTFPQPIRIGAKAVAWLEHEVDAWLEQQAQKRDLA